MNEALTVLFSVIHVIVALIIILVVLLQPGKAGGMGLGFGGTSQTIFGASGGVSFLAKVTIGSAITFMVTSIALSYLSHPHSPVVDSILDQEAADTEAAEEKAKEASASESAKTDQQPIPAAPAADVTTPAADAAAVPAPSPAAPAAGVATPVPAEPAPTAPAAAPAAPAPAPPATGQ